MISLFLAIANKAPQILTIK